jgi:hypothetical protein
LESKVTENLDPIFVTIAMAEILLGQNLVGEARRVIDRLSQSQGKDPRVTALLERIEAVSKQKEPISVEPKGEDYVTIETDGTALKIRWEMTGAGLAIAQKKARYSGQSVLRLFSAVPGPRGVRTSTQDIEVVPKAAELELNGLPRPAVYVAAVGFLSNAGEFVPLAQSRTLEVAP